MRNVTWDSITKSSDTNKAYDCFNEIFSSLYDKCFPKNKIKLKPQKYDNPWMTKKMKESSKRNQKLYEKFLTNRNKNKISYINLTKVFLNPLNEVQKDLSFE